jgi:imidazolonepropionase-like amidohydrolase
MLALFLLTALQSPAVDSLIAIRAGGMVDVEHGRLIKNVAIVVRHGRIAEIRPVKSLPPGASVIDLRNSIVLPGMIDAHVHFALGGAPRANAAVTLEAGFTTVQDLGALNYVNVRLRDSVAAGVRTGPRIVTAGHWVGISGGTCDFRGTGLQGAAAFADRVRQDIAQGVDVIKVCLTGWVTDGVNDASRVELDSAELAAVMSAARAAGKPVFAHAIGPAGARAAVEAGVRGLAHSAFIDSSLALLMKERGTYVVSTLWSLSGQNDSAAYQQLRERMRAAWHAGVPLVFGTDAGVIPHGQNAREFEALVGLGLSPPEAIRAATFHAARALGLGDSTGSITPGKWADLIAVRGSPLDDTRTLQQVHWVMKGGRVVKDVKP